MNDAERVQIGAACDLAGEAWSLLWHVEGDSPEDCTKIKVVKAMAWATHVLLEKILEVKTRENSSAQR